MLVHRADPFGVARCCRYLFCALAHRRGDVWYCGLGWNRLLRELLQDRIRAMRKYGLEEALDLCLGRARWSSLIRRRALLVHSLDSRGPRMGVCSLLFLCAVVCGFRGMGSVSGAIFRK
ncbi:hypothetical protein AVEN_197309-1 [Araneus ventricosus]|uniref:Uncharacterized protein n=1 Tax=Araneus ventricosus TaxID=182803 RepID=A0A4Y2F0C2_ARAVE|nr:hypothetical protein AVEN_197309-1 [Araneus ventricosus]